MGGFQVVSKIKQSECVVRIKNPEVGGMPEKEKMIKKELAARSWNH